MAWGHKLEIMDMAGNHIGTVREGGADLPAGLRHLGDQYMGQIKSSPFKPLAATAAAGR